MARIQLQADSTTLVLNGTVCNDFVDGDILTLTPVNPLTSRTRSTRGINIQKRSDAYVYDLAFTVPKYSEFDDFMSSQINRNEPVLFAGSVKENYIKDEEEFINTYTLEDGSITVLPTETKNNTDGNNAMLYTIQFNKVVRV